MTFVLLALATTAAALVGATLWVAAPVRHDTDLVNAAGRGRVLAERAYERTLLGTADGRREAEQSQTALRATFDALELGGTVPTALAGTRVIPPADTDELRAGVALAREAFAEFTRAAAPVEGGEADPAQLAGFRRATRALVDQQDHVVLLLERRAHERSDQLTALLVALLAVVLLGAPTLLVLVLRQRHGYLVEIEAREAIEHEARVARARAESTLDTCVDAVICIDDHGLVSSFNLAAEAMFGYVASAVIGRNVSMLMPEPHRTEHDGYIARYRETGERRIIGIGRAVRCRRQDGALFDGDLAISEAFVGEERLFTGIIRDVTERNRAAAELARSYHELEEGTRFDQTEREVVGLFATGDVEAVLDDVLRRLSADHGMTTSGFFACDEWSEALTCVASHAAPDELRRSARFGAGLVGQAAASRATVRIAATKDQALRIDAGLFEIEPAAIVAIPVRDKLELLGVLLVASPTPMSATTDAFLHRLAAQIGVQMHAARQYQNLKAMSERLAERGQKIARQNAELERANRLKSEFLANMSHELRTPLNAIIGFSEVLCDGILGPLEPPVREYVDDIQQSGRHLLDLINEVLDLSKIEAGKMKVEASPVGVVDLIHGSARMVREIAMNHGVHITVDADESLGECWLDARRCKQILNNLLSNAVKFTEAGGSVTLSANHLDGPGGGTLEIVVADTGIGIARDDIERLFQPFEQIDGSLSRRFEGTGLGLVMVRRLAQLHGGDVTVESTVGEGSRFTVRLPYRRVLGDEILAVTPAPFISRPTGAGRVLLVEDDESAVQLLEMHLKAAGFEVSVARSTEDGLAAVRRQRPDVVVLDLLLPGRDGWSFLAELKNHDTLATIPVVVVSIAADQAKGFAMGAADVLSKPVAITDLLTALDAAGVEPTNGSARILVVDDDPRAVELVGRQLEAAGYGVSRAFGGREALEAACADPPGAIVLDLMMPDVNGFDVLDGLHASPATAGVPVIVVTAKTLTDAEHEALRRSAVTVMGKRDFGAGHLLDEVRRVIVRQAAPVKPAGDRILIVDDDPAGARQLRGYLRDAGYGVDVVGGGEAALSFMHKTPVAAVVLDLMMPSISGYAVLEQMAADDALRAVPVAIVSAASVGGLGGAAATLRKPVPRGDLVEVVRRITGVNPTGRRSRVLVVDDDPSVATRVSSDLDGLGFEVVSCSDGPAAIEEAAARPPQLLLLDLVMAGMNGFEVMTRLRANEATAAIPVVIFTAGELDDEQRRRLAEADHLAVKGQTSRRDLVSLVDRLVAQGRRG